MSATARAADPARQALGLLGAPAYAARRIGVELGVLLLFARCTLRDGPLLSGPLSLLGWLNELRVVLALERARRLDVLSAGGEAAVAADPSRLFAAPPPPARPSWRRPWTWRLPGLSAGAPAPMGMGGPSPPILKELVLVGGGHSHVHVLRMWGMRPLPGVRLTLITRDVETPYSGMLPGHIAGQYSRDECHIDLVRLAAFAGARLIHAEASGLDLAGKRVLLAGERPPMRYDVLSVNIGCTPRLFGRAAASDGATGDELARRGGAEGVTAVKPIDGFGKKWDTLLSRTVDAAARAGSAAPPAVIAIVGGGGGGIELAFAIHARLRAELKARGQAQPGARAQVVLVGRAAEIMPRHAPAVRAAVAAALRARGIGVELRAEATGYDRETRELLLADGRRLRADESIWCTEGAAQRWLADSGLALDAAGFVRVGTTLAAAGRCDVFAAGDVASVDGHARPKSGVFAVRAGPPLERNLRAALLGERLRAYVPQASFLGLIGTGDGRAIASRGRLALREAGWLWDLKDWIDTKWMHAYAQGLPSMAEGAEADGGALALAAAAGAEALDLLAHAPMRCGGCGAKVGATVLSSAMARVRPALAAQMIAGVLDADDCAVWEEAPGGPVTVHTVDYFRAFVSDPYELGRIAAVHALSDCHAMGATPQLALAHVTLPLQVRARRPARGASCRAPCPHPTHPRPLWRAPLLACRVVPAGVCERGGRARAGHVGRDRRAARGGLRARRRAHERGRGGGRRLLGHRQRALGERADAQGRDGRGPGAAPHQADRDWRALRRAHAPRRARPLDQRGARVDGRLERAGGRGAARARRERVHRRDRLRALRPRARDVQGQRQGGHAAPRRHPAPRRYVRCATRRAAPCAGPRVSRPHPRAAAAARAGALECVAANIFSSLAPANMRLRHGLTSARTAEPTFALLFDPQTSGGLLASVPAERADACIAALRAAGCAHAAVIGTVGDPASAADGPLVTCV